MLGKEIVWNSKLKRININTNSNYDAKQKTEWLEEEIQPKEEIQTGNYDISDEMLSLVNDFGAILVPILFSRGIELIQEYGTTYRGGDWLDWLYNSIGILSGREIGRASCRERV